ncbi:tripartite tricarboxylate transporter substrate binding protein [Ramlibacter henchirensis]|uniref:Tripartite tricarboxylate transporter substrate binding protein n=1 Tax=Ramlibacter henchirensis TaxID=204072 RepID=A0A4Z0BWS9_9BURK|nr:tripartite tricarboxylate transporter substrate binding protein [Ramlibacter henchirensis]TFZ02708.1 tripartite tricarboxylate transporter substrate binding protein [Ramlibacter henchirensis]
MPHPMSRRTSLAALALAAAAASLPLAAQESFPIAGKPVTLILPAVGGSTGDRVLRMFADRLKEDWKVPVIVEAKPGAAGVVGTVHGVNAPPDGHTILLGYSHLTQAYAFNQKRPYDALTDLIPVARICDLPMMYLTADTSVRTLDAAIAKMKNAKGSYGSYGNATTSHIYSELVNRRNNLGMVHAAYRGTPPLITDLLGGQINTAVVDLGNTISHVKAGKLNALAITGNRRNRLVPDVPTFAELGYTEVSQPGRYWLMLPKGTPAATVERIRTSVLNVLKSPEVQEQMLAMGIDPAPPEREDVAANMRADVEYWKRVVQITGIRAND